MRTISFGGGMRNTECKIQERPFIQLSVPDGAIL